MMRTRKGEKYAQCGQSGACQRSGTGNRALRPSFAGRWVQFAVAQAGRKHDTGLKMAGLWRMSDQREKKMKRTLLLSAVVLAVAACVPSEPPPPAPVAAPAYPPGSPPA